MFFRLLAMGKTVKQIGKELDLSPQTVSTHRSHILEKMGMLSNAELIQYAIQNQIRQAVRPQLVVKNPAGALQSIALSRDFGVEHDEYPALRRWIRRFRGIDGFVVMPGIPAFY